MSFVTLSDQLTEAARLLREHPQGLDTKSFLAEADRFAKAFDKFRAALHGVVAGQSPEVQALGRAIVAVFSGDDKGLRAFVKKHVPPKGISLAGMDSLAQRAEKAAAKIASLGNAESALAELRLRDAPSRLDFSNQDDLALLQQIRQLGRISEDERQHEAEKLTREPEKVRLLARAAKIKFTSKTTAKALMKKVLEMGLRYAENTGR